MKRSIKSKNGFTLIEIVIVVSIIVILSAATFVGVDAVLDRANRNAQDLEENHGAHFEEEAWATVKNLSVDVEAFKETSETSIDPTETDPTETDPTVTESTMPTNDKDADFLTRRDELIEMGYLPEEITIIYGEDGHIKSMSWRSTRRGFANSNGYESQGYGVNYNADANSWEFNTTITFDLPIQSCTIVVPNGGSVETWGYDLWMYNIVDKGNGVYELTYKGSGSGGEPLTDINLRGPEGVTIQAFKSAE